MIPHSKPWIVPMDIEAVNNIIKSGMIAQGHMVYEFERALTKYLESADTVTCGSGSSALLLALKALSIGQGDEVVIPTYVCESVYNAVSATGAVPVLCDLGKDWLMTPASVHQVLTRKTKAIIVVHTFGLSADVPSIMEFGIPVIEDCCQSFGGRLNGSMLGSIGTMGIYSFHATKCLTTGEGGAVTSKDPEIMYRIRKMSCFMTYGGRMSDIQASMGLSQLSRYHLFLKHRQEIANEYFRVLPEDLVQPLFQLRHRSMFFRFPLRYTKVDFSSVCDHFVSRSINVRRGVDALLHQQYGMSDEFFPNAVRCYNETVCIPILPFLSKEEIKQIVDGVTSYELYR